MSKLKKFTISEYPEYLQAFATVRKACAKANASLGQLSEEKADKIVQSCNAIIEQKNAAECNESIYGSGRKVMSELIDKSILDILSSESLPDISRSDIDLNQSVGDVCATVNEMMIHNCLIKPVPACLKLVEELDSKAEEFKSIIKCGRFGLRDSDPVTLGRDFALYAHSVRSAITNLENQAREWNHSFLGMGDMGTGFMVDPGFRDAASKRLEQLVERELVFGNDIDTLSSMNQSARIITAHSCLERLAFVIWRFATDLEFLASGPRGGIREIALPAVAPGSSIMPGKINPTVAEMAAATCNRVISNHEAIMISVHRGWLDGPELALSIKCFIDGSNLLARTAQVLINKTIKGMTANPEKSSMQVERSLALSKLLIPVLGEDKTSVITKLAKEKNWSIREAAAHSGYLSSSELDRIFDLRQICGLSNEMRVG